MKIHKQAKTNSHSVSMELQIGGENTENEKLQKLKKKPRENAKGNCFCIRYWFRVNELN